MNQDSQDELVRLLKKSTFDVVYKAMEEYASTRGSSGTNVPKIEKILEVHGWTHKEFIDGLLHKLQNLDTESLFVIK